VNWSLSDKKESSAAFKNLALDATEDGIRIWSADRLSASGAYVRSRMKRIPPE
jgi:hypothetical protein